MRCPRHRPAEFEILGLLGWAVLAWSTRRLTIPAPAVAIKGIHADGSGGSLCTGNPWGSRSSSDQQTFQAGLVFLCGRSAACWPSLITPSLVKVFRFWEANNTAYMVMPLYSGMTFKQARAQMRTPPPEAWLRKVLWSVLGRCGCCTTARRCTAISRQTTSSCKTMAPVLLDLGPHATPSMTRAPAHCGAQGQLRAHRAVFRNR